MSNSDQLVVGTFTLRAQHLQFSVEKSQVDCVACLRSLARKSDLNTYPVNDEIVRFHLNRHFWLNTEFELYGHIQALATQRSAIVVISRIPGTTLIIWALYAVMISAVPFIFPTFLAHLGGSSGDFFLWSLAIWVLMISGNIAQVLLARAALAKTLLDTLQRK